jgi:hypothetical protein
MLWRRGWATRTAGRAARATEDARRAVDLMKDMVKLWGYQLTAVKSN